MNRLRNDLLAALGFVFLISTPAFTGRPVNAGLPVRYAAPNPQVDQKMKGQQPSRAEVEQELKSLLKRIFDQLVRLDFEMLKQTLADDFILTTGHGTVETRDEVFQRLANHSPDARLESIAATDIKARIYGEAAVITSRTTIIAQSKGRFSPTEWRATYVFVKRDGHWQMVGAQYTISNDK